MTFRQYLGIMIVGTLLCLVSWGIVLLNVDPFVATKFLLGLFYLTLFFSLFGTISLLYVLGAVFLFARGELLYRCVAHGFRFGLILAGLLTTLTYLQVHGLLNWWNIGALSFVLISLWLFQMTTREPSIKTVSE